MTNAPAGSSSVGVAEFVELLEFVELIEFVAFIGCVEFLAVATPPQVGVNNDRKDRD